MKIEFGGGSNPIKPNYLQVDIRQIDQNTMVCNAWEIDQKVKPGTVTDIFSRHFFEHLTHSQAKRTLEAWHTICAHGARVELICPNMKKHLWQWQNWKDLTEAEKDHCRAGLWGWQRESDHSSWDLHKSGYDFAKLQELVTAHKFKNIKKLIDDGIDQNHLWVEFYR